MSKTPQVEHSRQLASPEGHEGQENTGASLTLPAFQLMASPADSPSSPAQLQSAAPIQRNQGTIQERYAAHTLTKDDLTDQYVIDQFAALSIQQLFEYRRQCSDADVKAHLLTLIDGRQRDPHQSYLGKKFTISSTSAVIRDAAGNPLKYVEGDTIPTGKAVGDNKTIPNGTLVYITDIKSDLKYVHAEDWGWTAIDNIQGGMYNETLTIDRADYDSQDPNHKTIATHDCSIRTNSATTTFPLVTPAAKIPKDTKVTVLETIAEDGGNVRVNHNGADVWTRTSNLSTTVNDDGTRTVTSTDARIRRKNVDYALGSGTIPQGDRVIILQQSQDTERVGKYVEVARTKKNTTGAYERDTDKPAVWIAASNLADNWADFKSDNARWTKSDTSGTAGLYLGQMDVVTLIGRDATSGDQEVEKLSPQLLAHYNTLRAQAATAGHDIQLNSGWRSFPDQQELWDDNPNPAQVARPGRSNHQNGIAIDINTGSFTSAMYLWMKANAPALGWIRTVDGEHWHWEQRPADAAAHGYKLPSVSP
jgi:hypothetical protein